MNPARPRRGQPLIALGALLLGWVGLRAALWEQIELPGLPAPVVEAAARVLPATRSEAVAAPAVRTRLPVANAPTVRPSAPMPAPVALPPVVSVARPVMQEALPLPEFATAGGPGDTARVAAAHQPAWMAGVAQLPMPRFVTDRSSTADRPFGLIPAEAGRARVAPLSARRWSADGWLLLREGGAGLTAAGLPSPSYGASQAGAVLRYRLSPDSAHRPALYLRATTAVHPPRGEEVAAGLSARPLANLPVAVLGELRGTRQTSGVRWRPALGAVTELPRFNLPAGLTGEAYGQAGYVGGADATAFVDGQLRIERRLRGLGRGELRAGLGAWGGAQKGANRIDVGPSAVIDFPLGGGQGRLSADWRLRAAGNAAPKSGPAITLSAGF